MLSYAPPVYHSVDNLQAFGTTPYIVPPPVFDPTDFPPPYSSRNPSLSNSHSSLSYRDCGSYCGSSRRESHRTSLYTQHSATGFHVSHPDQFMQTQLSLCDYPAGLRDTSPECGPISSRADVDQGEDILLTSSDTTQNSAETVNTADSAATTARENLAGDGQMSVAPSRVDPNVSSVIADLCYSQNSPHCISNDLPKNSDISTLRIQPIDPSLSNIRSERGARNQTLAIWQHPRNGTSPRYCREHPTCRNPSNILKPLPNFRTSLRAPEDSYSYSRHAVKEEMASSGTENGKARNEEGTGRGSEGEYSKGKEGHVQEQSGKKKSRMGRNCGIETGLSCSKETIV